MNVPVIAFFGLKGGQGKTTLVHHLSWMFSDLGVRVVAADLDPQSNLTQAFLGLDAAVALAVNGETLHGSFRRFVEGTDKAERPPVVRPDGRIALLAGDVALWELESVIADAWRLSLIGDPRSGAALSALRWIFEAAARDHAAQVVLVDLPSNFGFIHRAAFAAADHFVVPVVPDVLAVKTLRFAGELLDLWRDEWRPRRAALHGLSVALPSNGPEPLGYVVQVLRSVVGGMMASSQRSINELPGEFRRWITKSPETEPRSLSDDDRCLGMISTFHSHFQIAMEAHKPVFHLTPANGAVGSMMQVVLRVRAEFELVARRILARLDIPLDGGPS